MTTVITKQNAAMYVIVMATTVIMTIIAGMNGFVKMTMIITDDIETKV